MKPVSILLTLSLVLAGCGTVRDSRLNPFNWFGGSRAAPVEASEDVNLLIPRRNPLFGRDAEVYAGEPIGEIVELLIERRPGGAILRASGVADRAGPFDARLTREDSDDISELVYALRVLQAPGSRSVGPAARTVTVAVPLTDQDLRGVRTIRVLGERNQRVSRR